MLMKYKPFDNLFSLERNFNNLLKSSFTDKGWIPEADVVETDSEIKIQLECAGLSPNNLKVTYDKNMLTVSGEKKNENEEKTSSYHRLERSFGKFSRSFSLPIGIEENSLSAEYKDGVLSIVATKSEDAQVKTIEIKTLEETKPKVLSASG